MYKRVLRAAVVICVATFAINSFAKPLQPVHQVEGINEYRLDNGLKVLLFPDPTKETVTVNVTYKVGSKHENYGETGMAHLLEHLLFKGSKKHKDIPAELSAHGAKPNGTTWIDRTNYFETFVATEENIDWALSLEADRMVNSFIAREDLDSEMTVVRNEFEMTENNPFAVLMQAIMLSAYDWHNNGKPTIGARSDIENVSIDRLQNFYRTYYQPDNAVLVVAGKFDEQEVLKKIRKTFGKIKKPKRQLPMLYTREPAADGEKSVTVRRVGDMQLYASAYHVPAGYSKEYPALEALSQILGDTPRGRLHREVTEKNLAVGTYAFPFQLQSPGLMFFAAQADKSTDLDKTRSAMIDVIEGVKSNPITEQELETAQRSLLNQFEQAFKSPETIAIMLSEYIGMGDWRLMFLTRDRIEALTVADVQKVAETYLVRNNRAEGRFIPTEEPQRIEIPVAAPVAEQLKGFKGREVQALGEAFDPSFENIKNRTEVRALGNGAEVALLPKKSRGEEVVVSFTLNFGTEQSLTGLRTPASLVPPMFMRGTQTLDRKALKTEFDKIKTEVSIDGDVQKVSGTLNTQREHVVAAIELLSQVLKQPGFDEQEFNLLLDQYLAQLEAGRQDPNSIVRRESARLFNSYPKDHPLYAPTLDESIAAIKNVKLGELKQFYQNFYGADNMQLAVVGDFEVEPVMQALQQAFGDWKSPKPYEVMTTPFETYKAVNRTFETPDKENAIYIAKLLLPVQDTDNVAPALRMGLYMLGGGFLNSRIATRLRQQEGLSYGAGAWLGLGSETARSEVGAYAIFAPQNLKAVRSAMKEEIQKVIKDGFTEQELADAKRGYLQDKRVDRTDSGNIAGLLQRSLFLDRAIDWGEEFEQAIEELSVEDVNSAFRKYVDPEAFSILQAGDFAKHENP